MKLRTKLLLATIIAGLLVAAISILLVWSALAVSAAADNMARATQVVNAISDLRFLTFENLLYHDQTSRAQWDRENSTLTSLLQPTHTTNTTERATLQHILELSSEIKPLFDRLVATYGTSSASPDQQQLQERLASQILIKQQTQINDMLQLASTAQAAVTQINNRASLFVGVTVIFMLAVTIGNFLVFTRSVTSELRKLQKGAQEIAARHFGYRIKTNETDDEFGEVAKAFNDMAVATGRLDQAKSEFIVLATHQLKTPIAELKSYAEGMLIDGTNARPEKRIHYLYAMRSVCDRASHLINNLLDISQIERGGMTVELAPQNLRELVDRTVHTFEQELRAKHLSLHVESPNKSVPVLADALLTTEALRNVIHNAVKFTEQGGITVTLSTSGKMGVITIADTGAGVSRADRRSLFQSNGMLGKPLMSGQGAKLGLYVTNKFLSIQGGSIALMPGAVGAVFQIKLPLYRAQKMG